MDDRFERCPEDGATLTSIFPGTAILDRKYRLLRRIGSGGIGSVFKARHLGLSRIVAIKILQPHRRDDRFNRGFRREARLLARLDHPNVVDVHDYGLDAERGIAYLAMEFVDGVSLAARVRQRGPLSTAETVEIVEQVAAALAAAHRAGIVHGDVKASNVILRNEEMPGHRSRPARAVLVDLGLARLLVDPDATPDLGDSDASDESAGSKIQDPPAGTPGYMAPELFDGAPPSPASDVFALGILARFLVTGWTESPASEVDDRLHWLDAAIDPALDLQASRRPSPGALAKSLRAKLLLAQRRRQLKPRVAAVVVLALVAAATIPNLEIPLRWLENALVESRFASVDPRPVRHPILLVSIDDDTVRRPGPALGDLGDEAGRWLDRVMRAGAAGIAIDLLLPPRWGTAPAFSRFVLEHRERLVLAAYSPSAGSVVGPEVLDPLSLGVLGPRRAEELFGFVNVVPDNDGILRRTRPTFRDRRGDDRPSFALRAARLLRPEIEASDAGPRWLDLTVDRRALEPMSWHSIPLELERDPARFQDQLVLIGASFAGSGDEVFRVPSIGDEPVTLSGLEIQALAIHSLLDGAHGEEITTSSPGWRTFAMAAFAAAASLSWLFGGSGAGSRWTSTVLLAGAWIGLAWIEWVAARRVWPIAAPVLALAMTSWLAHCLDLGLLAWSEHQARRNSPRTPLWKRETSWVSSSGS